VDVADGSKDWPGYQWNGSNGLIQPIPVDFILSRQEYAMERAWEEWCIGTRGLNKPVMPLFFLLKRHTNAVFLAYENSGRDKGDVRKCCSEVRKAMTFIENVASDNMKQRIKDLQQRALHFTCDQKDLVKESSLIWTDVWPQAVQKIQTENNVRREHDYSRVFVRTIVNWF
jgi:hypothetical protein